MSASIRRAFTASGTALDTTRALGISSIRERVIERRYGDKGSPLVRWAIASTWHIRLEGRVSHVAAGLPAGIIGDHARSHLEWSDDLVPDGAHRSMWCWTHRSNGIELLPGVAPQPRNAGPSLRAVIERRPAAVAFYGGPIT